MNNDLASCPELCPRLVELRECGIDYRIVRVDPDRITIIVVNAEPEPFLVEIPFESAPRTVH